METKIEETIEEQPVSYKTAKLANEKGFDWPSDRCYICKSHDLTGRVSDWRKEILKGTVIFAPTPAFLQRWLREKHNYHIILIIDEIDFKYKSRVYRWKNEPDFIFGINSFGINGSKSFEQTLEKALYNTLLLKKYDV